MKTKKLKINWEEIKLDKIDNEIISMYCFGHCHVNNVGNGL